VVNGKPSGDITQGSEGQKDVFDLAFNLVLMAMKGLKGYPLFLDEIGATFDDSHRDNLVNYIKGLLDTNEINQIFMISHYNELTGAMSNSQSIVLHEDNLMVVPSNANEHVTIK
jgi:DNA repair exonuclease SbcCD ATPase subunit